MTSAATMTGMDQDAGRVADGPLLPLVSVVVVNFNYGRFLEEAIESVFRQTWPRFECIVVDNASTDGSGEVIAACAARHPEIVVHQRADNGGQTTACIEGLGRARGAYVVFLDADDYLLPHCLTTHMAVHLASRVHVGFTTGEMLQVADGQVVLTTNQWSDQFLEERARGEAKRRARWGWKKERHTAVLRPTAVVGSALRDRGLELAARVHLVPRSEREWVWSPTSGNCFRRDILVLLCDNDRLGELRSQTDLYLALGVNALCGSLIVDEPVFCYRLHGSNVFSSRAQLQGFLSHDIRRTGQQSATARRLIVDHLVKHPDRFMQEDWQRKAYFATLRGVDTQVRGGPWHNASYSAHAVATAFDAVAAIAGRKATFDFVFAGAPWRIRLAMLLRRRPVLS